MMGWVRRHGYWLLMWSSMLALAGFVFVAISLRDEPVGPDNCRQDGVIPAHTVFLIDQSDPFNVQDTHWVNQLISSESRSLQRYGKFTVLAISRDGGREPLEIFSRCSPGAPNAFTFLFRNERLTEQDWSEKFKLDLEERVADVMLNKQANYSPLLEHFEAVMRRPDFAPFVENRRLVVVTDLVQNTPRWSHYRNGADWDDFERTLDYSAAKKFENVYVRIHVVERHNGPDPQALREFWRVYFEDIGGGEVDYVIDF